MPTNATSWMLILDALDRLDRLTAAVERLESVFSAWGGVAPSRSSRRGRCIWLLEGEPCPRDVAGRGHCYLHRQRAIALARKGVSPGEPAYIEAMGAPVMSTRPPRNYELPVRQQ
jgi:hypothetical protein